MPTALVHPRREAALRAFYPHRCTVWRLGREGSVGLLDNVPAAYEPASGGPAGLWQGEGPGAERIRLSGWFPRIAAPAQATLTLADGLVKRFDVVDALPSGPGPEATVLLVTARS